MADREARIVYLPTLNAPLLDCWCGYCHNEYGNVMADLDPERSRLWSLPFIVCPDCGNKRCPRATYHGHDCNWSNDPGQSGSMYGVVPNGGRP